MLFVFSFHLCFEIIHLHFWVELSAIDEILFYYTLKLFVSHMVTEIGWICLSVKETWKQSQVLVANSNVQMAKREKHF